MTSDRQRRYHVDCAIHLHVTAQEVPNTPIGMVCEQVDRVALSGLCFEKVMLMG